jgi:hypothetical protein
MRNLNMSETQTAISFKIPADIRRKIAEITQKHRTTLTGLVLDYFRRRVEAEEEMKAAGRGVEHLYTEVLLLLEDNAWANLRAEAAKEEISASEYLRRLCEGERRHSDPASARAEAAKYPEFPHLVDCVRKAYQEDRSPIDALLKLYPTLPPSTLPMETLFTAALQAVPVVELIRERVELGIRLWREQREQGHRSRRTDHS